MKLLFIFVFLFIYINITYAQEDTTSAIPISKDSISIILNTLCENIHYEFMDLYDKTTVIPENDYLKLKALLEDRGYKLKDIGRGNWDKGPRIIVATMKKDDCECTIIKKYYSDYDGKTDQTLLMVTEEIKCRKVR